MYIKSKLKLQTAGKVSLMQNLTKQYVGFIKSNQLNESKHMRPVKIYVQLNKESEYFLILLLILILHMKTKPIFQNASYVQRVEVSKQ